MKWIEIPLLIIAIAIAIVVDYDWPSTVSAGQLMLVFAVVFLVHTLVRDLILYTALTRGRNREPRREARCFCVESGIGMLMVALGLILFLTNIGGHSTLVKMDWIVLLAGLLVVNYLLKDLVFSWNPWRIYRDPGHLNIVPRL